MAASVSQIEQKIIEALRGIPKIRLVDTLDAMLARRLDDNFITPSLYVAYLGSDYEGTFGAPCVDKRMDFAVLVFVQNVVGKTLADIRPILSDIFDKISGKDFGLDILPFIPVSERPVDAGPMFSVWEVVFSTGTRISLGV